MEAKERLDELNRKILTLEWDQRQNQLSESKSRYLETLQKERDELTNGEEQDV